MANTNFIQVNPNQDNMVADLTYSTDSFRLNGGTPSSVCPTLDFNKALYQVSTWVAAMANMLVAKGYSPLDGSASSDPGIVTPTTAVNNLAAILANIRTNADSLYTFTTISSSGAGSVASGQPWLVEGITVTGVTRNLYNVSGNAIYTLTNLAGGTVTLNAFSGQLINGSASATVSNSITIVSNGSNWVIINQY